MFLKSLGIAVGCTVLSACLICLTVLLMASLCPGYENAVWTGLFVYMLLYLHASTLWIWSTRVIVSRAPHPHAS